jgi:hypothetical protein
VFYEQASEGGYVAFLPVLPGCHTQGETLEDKRAQRLGSHRSLPGKPGGPWQFPRSAAHFKEE